jgi:formylglycine-generating enzyme required for sulfatase activity
VRVSATSLWPLSFVLACSDPTAGTPAPVNEPEQAPEAPTPAEAAPAAEAPAAAEPAAEPEPEAEPEPPKLVAPNGVEMKACPEDRPEAMSCIPGGPFTRGSNDHWDHAKPQAEVWVQSFWMDQYEVTYAEYKACQKAGECNRAGPQYVDFDRPAQPINGISWFDADKYCKAQGKRLPTEAEWEKAARGGDARLYPWGDEEASCEQAIMKGVEEGRGCGVLKSGKKPETGYPWNVGSRAPNPYGLYDMAGNAYEWVNDWFSTSYEACGEDCSGVDPKGPCQGAESCHGFRRKVVRGGSWYWDATRATTIYRRAHVPRNQPFHHFGFRCAADLEAGVKAPDVKWRQDLREGKAPGGDPGGQKP